MPHKHALVLLALIVAGVLLGVFCGWYWGSAMLSVAWMGTLFLNLLKMTIIPLIVAAVITGVSSMGGVGGIERIGAFTFLYYMVTTAVAVLIGLVMVNLIQPGAGMAVGMGELPAGVAAKQETGISDIILAMVSPNLVKSAAETQLLPIILFSIVFAVALVLLGEKGKPVINFF